MKRTNFLLLTIIIFWALPALACGLSNANLPDADEVASQAAEAATKAAEVAATAVVIAEQAVDAAATAAASEQAQNAAATAVAAATAASNIELPDTTALQEKFASVQPDENGNIIIVVTDDEMNQAIQAKQAAAEQTGGENLVQGATVAFTGDAITLIGNITEPITAQLTVVFRPYVADSVLQFEVVSAQVGSISVPPSILSAAESTLNATLSDAMSYMPANITLQDVVMGAGTMTIMGQKQ